MIDFLRKIWIKKGFTLIELLLVIAIMALLAGLSFPIFMSLQTQSDVDLTANITIQNLRRAQNLSQAGTDDSVWGVYIAADEMTLFRGESYLTRDDTVDELFDISPKITPSGLNEITFDKLTGEPSTIGDIILSTEDKIITITINAKGVIDSEFSSP